MRLGLLLAVITCFFFNGCWELPFAETKDCDVMQEQCVGTVAFVCNDNAEWDSSDCSANNEICVEDGGPYCVEDPDTDTTTEH